MGKFIDLTGQKFGRWQVLERCKQKDKHNKIIWICQCECGTLKKHSTNAIKSGHTKGCVNCDYLSRKKNLLGQKFYKWTVLKMCEKDKWGGYLWLCRCECGVEKRFLEVVY